MKVEQFVMAYSVEQDRIRAMLPNGFVSLRPVLRINAEIRDGTACYLELNTPVSAYGKRGWLNIANWPPLLMQRRPAAITAAAGALCKKNAARSGAAFSNIFGYSADCWCFLSRS